jgi:hypothetical protein
VPKNRRRNVIGYYKKQFISRSPEFECFSKRIKLHAYLITSDLLFYLPPDANKLISAINLFVSIIYHFSNRFSWLGGAYGVIGSNENIPRLHFYVTIKNGADKSKVFDDLEKSFDCEPKKYFELRSEPKTPVTFRYLTKPASGGRILAVDQGPNPARAPNDIVDQTTGSLGTLTMFSFHNNKHYALTCFHVGCTTDKQRHDKAFNVEELMKIRKSKRIKWHKEFAKSRRFDYGPRHNRDDSDDIADTIPLGEFGECSFDTKNDIMSIQVFEGVETDCRMEEIDFPSWTKISRYILTTLHRKGRVPAIVKIDKTSKEENGYIHEINYSHPAEEGENCYEDAVVVKCNSGTVLRPGDSGALVCYLDKHENQKACAYVVCEASEGDEGIFIICLRLNNALKNFKLTNKGCFKKCGRGSDE